MIGYLEVERKVVAEEVDMVLQNVQQLVMGRLSSRQLAMDHLSSRQLVMVHPKTHARHMALHKDQSRDMDNPDQDLDPLAQGPDRLLDQGHHLLGHDLRGHKVQDHRPPYSKAMVALSQLKQDTEDLNKHLLDMEDPSKFLINQTMVWDLKDHNSPYMEEDNRLQSEEMGET